MCARGITEIVCFCAEVQTAIPSEPTWGEQWGGLMFGLGMMAFLFGPLLLWPEETMGDDF